MTVTRRNAMLGASAAVLVAGVPGATSAAGDPQIEALLVQLQAADAHAKATGTDDAWDQFIDIQAEIIETPCATLRGTLKKARICWDMASNDLEACDSDPYLDGKCCRLDDSRFIWSLLQDLERLAGESAS